MAEILGERRERIDLLKKQILRLHGGEALDDVRDTLRRMLKDIPYNDVVAAEQELVADGLPEEEIIKLCDLHSAALKGNLAVSGREIPPGHPVHTFAMENEALRRLLRAIASQLAALEGSSGGDAEALRSSILFGLNELMSLDIHYRKKENLLFPFLESHGITAPPKVMWAKDDEVRAHLKDALEAVRDASGGGIEGAMISVVKRACDAVEDMVVKEEGILFPMSLDTLDEKEWAEIYRQTPEIGYCLYSPEETWNTAATEDGGMPAARGDSVTLPSGSMPVRVLTAIFNSIPADITFVDRDDTVRYFSQGKERIFDRNRAIIGRKVQHCHPPKSVHAVESILRDFRSGARDSAAFWITMKGRFIHIEYLALRDDAGNYLGTLEFTQDLTGKRALQGERRLLENP